MTNKQFEELLQALKEVKLALESIQKQPQYVFVTQTPPASPLAPQPDTNPNTTPYWPGSWPVITCKSGSVGTTEYTVLSKISVHQ